MFDFSSRIGSFGRTGTSEWFEFSLGQLDHLEETIRASLEGAGICLDDVGGLDPMTIPVSRTIDQTYSVGGEPRLTVENFSGETRIQGSDEDVIRVRASGIYLDDAGLPRNIRQDGNHLTIKQAEMHGPQPVDYHISVPRGCRLTITGVDADIVVTDTAGTTEVQTVSGDVSITGVGGGCRIKAVDGDVTLSDIVGACILSSVSSDIKGTQIRGPLEAHAVDGDISIDRSALSQCVITSVSGDVLVETAIEADGGYSLQSTNGDVRLVVPRDAALTVSMSSRNGDILTGDLEINHRDRHRREGTLGGGGAAVRLETFQGDVALETIDGDENMATVPETSTVQPVPAVEPIAAVEPLLHNAALNDLKDLHDLDGVDDLTDVDDLPGAQSSSPHEPEREHTIDVLARLERGELTVEEAMAHLSDV